MSTVFQVPQTSCRGEGLRTFSRYGVRPDPAPSGSDTPGETRVHRTNFTPSQRRAAAIATYQNAATVRMPRALCETPITHRPHSSGEGGREGAGAIHFFMARHYRGGCDPADRSDHVQWWSRRSCVSVRLVLC